MASTSDKFPAPDFYTKVRLTISSGSIEVVKVAIPPFTELPAILIWGDRTFFKIKEAKDTDDNLAVYDEIFSYVVIHDPIY